MKFLLSLSIACLFLSACHYKRGSGHIISETKDISGFSNISVSGPFGVELGTGKESVVVEADDNLMEYINVSKEGTTLKVSMERHLNLRDAHLTLVVSAPVWEKIQGSAAADIAIKEGLTSTGNISLQTSSAASIKGAVDAPAIRAESSSGSKIQLSGRTRKITAESSSGASVLAEDLLSEEANASASSGGRVTVHASVSLKASASSGGDVEYRGGANVNKSESSGGGVKKMD